METGTSPTPIKRRLTAILAADAVGYSRQMSENEEATRQVLAAQRAIIDRLIDAHEGRIFGTAGDSVLAEFASSVEAVRCAVEIQEALQTRNESVPESQRLEFRIGINLGDVMVDGADILGDGVNVAARLESIADPGGICISSSVHDQILGKLSLGFVDLGEKALKNIARPIRVYRFDRSGEMLGADRHARPSRKVWLIIGGAVLLVFFAAGAWQAGLFKRRTAPVSPPPPLTERRPSVAPARNHLGGNEAEVADRGSRAGEGRGRPRQIPHRRRSRETASGRPPRRAKGRRARSPATSRHRRAVKATRGRSTAFFPCAGYRAHPRAAGRPDGFSARRTTGATAHHPSRGCVNRCTASPRRRPWRRRSPTPTAVSPCKPVRHLKMCGPSATPIQCAC